MFDNCYVRLGSGALAGCQPLTVELLASLYALPYRQEGCLYTALAMAGEDKPWSASLLVAPEATTAAVGPILRSAMLATPRLDPAELDLGALPGTSRARRHLAALRELWLAHPEAVPADLQHLRDFLGCEAGDALQPLTVIRASDETLLSPFERAVLARLESHHPRAASDDPDARRLIFERSEAAAPPSSLAGHVQRHLLDPSCGRLVADDSLALLSVRDSLTECEAAVAIIQRWQREDATLAASEIAVILPENESHASHLAECAARSGLACSGLPAGPLHRNVGSELVHLFVRSCCPPAPAMAQAALHASPLLCWPSETGAQMAREIMGGATEPPTGRMLEGPAGALRSLLRAPAPQTNAELADRLSRLRKFLSGDPSLEEARWEALGRIARLCEALATDPGAAPDWEAVLPLTGAYMPEAATRGPHFLGGVTVLHSGEAPKRRFRKLLVLGFNEGRYPAPASSNPLFLDSEIDLIRSVTQLELSCGRTALARSLDLFRRQLCAASEEIVLLCSERDGLGAPLAPATALPLIARLIEGMKNPAKLVAPLASSAGTAWDRLIDWQPTPEFKSAARPAPPAHFDLGCDLLALRRNADGSLKPQSPSRLENLLVSPLAWLLAELDAAHVAWQPEALDVMLRGTLAHGLFEDLFAPGAPVPGDEEIAARLPGILAARIHAEAPFLEAATWRVERGALEAELLRAARNWADTLRALEAEVMANEFWLEGELFGHPVRGKADCLLQLPGGLPIVVDHKKSGSSQRRKRMNAQYDLQVELYRRMRVPVAPGDNGDPGSAAACLAAWSKPPAVAYHTLNDSGVLLNGAGPLACSEVEKVPDGIADLALARIEARFAELRAGQLATNGKEDEKEFGKLGLGSYALSASPLVAAFMRDGNAPQAGDSVDD